MYLLIFQKEDSSDVLKISLKEQTALLVFLGHCFMSMEVKLVRECVQKLVSLTMWDSILESRRDHELKICDNPIWRKAWKGIKKKDAKQTDENVKVEAKKERWFLNIILKLRKSWPKSDGKWI